MVRGLLVLTLFLTLLLFGYYIDDAKRDSNGERHKQSIHAALNGGSMSTPDGFRRACGEPRRTRTAAGTLIFDYDNNLLVSFPAKAAVRFGMKIDINSIPEGMPVGEDWAMDHLRCNP